MEVDGPANTVLVSESEAVPVSDDNPYGLALVQRTRALETEADGRQDYDWSTQRTWKVVNRGRPNRHGTPAGYTLVPSASFPALVDRSSPILRRAGVIDHTLWVTPYREDERWPCGEFVNQSRHDTGLAQWTQADRPIADTDIVLWHVFGIHHIPRPEDWPVMPVDTVSFSLKPSGFFDRNPTLDVPPTEGRHCH
jgi:primary-amine oxidase